MAVNFIRWNASTHIYELSTNDGASFSALPLDASILNQGIIGSVARIATGTPDGTKFVRDDLTLAVPAGTFNPSTVWPIGSVFISVVSTNPNTLLGFGTWSAIAAGRVLVGIDSGDTDFDTVEETGGAKTHTLQVSEMPSHTHTQDPHNHTQDAHAHNIKFNADQGASGSVEDIPQPAGASTSGIVESATATNQAATATNQNTGGGGAHNNVQPYFVVYMWKRTA